jgi:hypothetical protein
MTVPLALTRSLKSPRLGTRARALVGVLALLVAGCTDSVRWTEDVRLPDGRVIVLQRYAEFARPGGGAETLQRIEFSHPATGKPVVWENARHRRENVSGGILTTIALFESGGNMFLLTLPAYGNDQIYFNCPDPPYLLFEHRPGGWVSKPIAQIPVQILRANLTDRIGIARGREALAKAGGHLGLAYTGNHERQIRDERGRSSIVPYVIDFRNQPQQTFGVYENCDRPLNYLTAKQEEPR